MTYKNPNLSNLSILDTPGFNSNDKEDKERTIGVINECDALFWVFDVNAGTVNRSSIELIKANLNKPLIVVINKVDTKPKTEVDQVEELIKKTLSECGVKVEKYVRFSSNAPLADIMNPIQSINRDESRMSFVNFIEDDLNKLSDLFAQKVNKNNSAYQKCENKVQQLSNQFIQGLSDLRCGCNEAKDIPRFNEGTKIFGVNLTDDSFKMTVYQGQALRDILQEIAGSKCDRLAQLFDQETKAMAELQQAYSDMIDVKVSWQKIDECLNEFKKVSKNLK